MSECNHNCATCSSKECHERDLSFHLAKGASIKHTIGIISAKGGVGKSLLTALIAIQKNREGNKVAILDADVTGPSIPKSFNVKGALYAENNLIIPLESKTGIKVVSASSLLEDNSQPILWRGPLIAGMVKQFYSEVNYGDLDYLLIDTPPGTGDIALTIFQSIKVDGVIIVTTPQDLVKEIVSKAIEMCNKMNIKIIGVIENMSYLECPDCHKHIDIFGKSHIEEIANKYNLKILGRIPINSKISELVDNGNIEDIKDTYISF